MLCAKPWLESELRLVNKRTFLKGLKKFKEIQCIFRNPNSPRTGQKVRILEVSGIQKYEWSTADTVFYVSYWKKPSLFISRAEHEKGLKHFFTYIHLDLFRSHPSIYNNGFSTI